MSCDRLYLPEISLIAATDGCKQDATLQITVDIPVQKPAVNERMQVLGGPFQASRRVFVDADSPTDAVMRPPYVYF